MSSGPQGPGWWRASDGRWYPPQPAAPAARSKSTRGIWIAVLAVVVVLIAGVGIGGYLIVRAVTNEVSSALGVGDLECPASGDIGELLGSPVSGPAGGSMIVASGCYYTGAVYDVIIVSGSTLIADEQIASMVGEGEAGGAEVRDIDVGDKGRVWASDTKSSAIAVGADALVSVEVQGKDFASIPDRSGAAVAILERVLR